MVAIQTPGFKGFERLAVMSLLVFETEHFSLLISTMLSASVGLCHSVLRADS